MNTLDEKIQQAWREEKGYWHHERRGANHLYTLRGIYRLLDSEGYRVDQGLIKDLK